MGRTVETGGAVTARSAYLDNAKAGLIVLVVFTHLFSLVLAQTQPGTSVYQLIMLFHMPAFAFVSGMLSKPQTLAEEGPIALRRAAWAYLLFNGLNYLWARLFFGRNFVIKRVFFDPVFAMWFLLALFWWRLVLPLFALGKSRRAAIISVAVAVGISIGAGYVVPDDSWMGLSRTCAFLPFFVAGYRVRQQGLSLPRTPAAKVAGVCALAVAWAFLYFWQPLPGSVLLRASVSYERMGLSGISGAQGRLAVLCASFALVAAFMVLVPHRRTALTVLGPATLSIYVWHALAVRNIRYFDVDPLVAGSLPAVVITTTVMVIVFGVGFMPRFTEALVYLPWRRHATAAVATIHPEESRETR